MAENRVIGKDNKLPWHFSSDLKYFKQLTMGSAIIMGRKTFESIGKPLPGRKNLILSRDRSRTEKGVFFCASLQMAFDLVDTPNAFIIGGSHIFEQTIQNVDGIYLTLIHQKYEGDAFYPEIPANFKEIKKHELQSDPKIEAVYYEKSKC